MYMYTCNLLSYSAKFLKDKLFADWLFETLRRNKFCDPRILDSHTHYRGSGEHVWIVAAIPVRHALLLASLSQLSAPL